METKNDSGTCPSVTGAKLQYLFDKNKYSANIN